MLASFLRNLGFLAVAQTLARARGFILLPIMSRYLGTSEFGVWAQVSIIVFSLSPIVMLGTENALIRLLPGLDEATQRRRFSAWAIFTLAGSAVAAAAVILGRSSVAAAFFGGGGDFRRFVPLAAASLFASLLYVVGRMWFVVRNDGPAMAGAVILQAGGNLAGVLIAVALKGGVFEILLYGVIGDAAAGLALLAWAARRGAFGRPDFGILGAAIRFGIPLVPAGYALWAINWIDRLFLVHYRSLAEIGVYAAAYSLGYAVVQLFTTSIWAIYPSTAAALHTRGDHHALARLIQGTVSFVLFIGVPAVAGLWMLDRPIVAIVAGPGYESGAPAVPLIALAYMFNMLASFADVSLGLSYRQYLSTVSIGVAVIVNIALNFALIPRFGLIGAAWATAIGFLCQFLCAWMFALRYGVFWCDLSAVPKIVVAAAAMTAALWLAGPRIGGTTLVHLAAMIALGAGLYLGLALLLRLTPRRLAEARAPLSTGLEVR